MLPKHSDKYNNSQRFATKVSQHKIKQSFNKGKLTAVTDPNIITANSKLSPVITSFKNNI